LALFRRKSSEVEETTPNGETAETTEEVSFTPDPDKAQSWFNFARTAADSANHEYALHCYASGLRFDPESMSAHDAFFAAAIAYMNKGGKPASSKEIKAIDDGTPIGRFAAAEFTWMKDIKNAKLAVKAIEAAVKANQIEWGNHVSEHVYKLLRSQKKPSKSLFVQAMDLFEQVEAYDHAIGIGQAAFQLDTRDSDLEGRLNDLSVSRTMQKGGYDKAAGKEGGYREMVRDIDKQRELEEMESISGSQSTEDRNLARAKQAYDTAPNVPDNVNTYAQLLKKRGDVESENKAYDIYIKGAQDTGEYRFRMLAGDIRIGQMARELKQLDEQIDAAGGADEALRQQRESLHHKLLELRRSEYTERVTKYPTDRQRKYDLGMVLIDLENYEEAMGQFQAAKDEPKIRVKSSYMLGRCFAAEGWHMEAIAEYEEALDAIDATQKELELDVRYELMVSLIAHAREEQSVDLARRALDICSGIARKNITYRDIRARRKEIDTLIKELSGG
jgi:tetratricopeptide (TPR) repeat protein